MKARNIVNNLESKNTTYICIYNVNDESKQVHCIQQLVARTSGLGGGRHKIKELNKVEIFGILSAV